jgi:hypothetical protein
LQRSSEREHNIKQGDSLPTLLITIGLEEVIRSVEFNARGKIFNRFKQFMAYGEDVAVLGRTAEKINQSLRNYEQLVINTDETNHN